MGDQNQCTDAGAFEVVQDRWDQIPGWVYPRASNGGPVSTKGVHSDGMAVGYGRKVSWELVVLRIGEQVNVRTKAKAAANVVENRWMEHDVIFVAVWWRGSAGRTAEVKGGVERLTRERVEAGVAGEGL